MKVYIDFIFRSYTLQNGGRFKNSLGRDIVYDSKYLLIGDIIEDDKATPVIFKTRSGDKVKIEKLLNDLKPYDKCSVECELSLYNKNISLILLNVKKV